MTLMQKIRDICTYHGDEGTSGYLLSEEQFNQIEKAVDFSIKEHGGTLKDLSEYDKKTTISLCPHCMSMTRTLITRCGKCGGIKDLLKGGKE